MTAAVVPPPSAASARRPRLGFIGTGWIGRLRMEALQAEDCAEFAAVYEPGSEARAAALALAPDAAECDAFEALLAEDLDGVVISTPSALHAEQCLQALAAGHAVFCQKPLARTHAETARVVQAAQAADRLLGVDFSYRHLAGMERVRQLIQSGELGEVFAAELTFHNAYGPDKPWFFDVSQSGGGCVIDLGIHLVDLAFWLLGRTEVGAVSSRLYRGGRPLAAPFTEVEDFASAEFAVGATDVRLNCSWHLHAGRDAVIEAHFYGTQGGAVLRNVNGSFYDFELVHCRGTSQQLLAAPPDAWGGRALTHWSRQLASGNHFDPAVLQVVQVAEVIDRIYRR